MTAAKEKADILDLLFVTGPTAMKYLEDEMTKWLGRKPTREELLETAMVAIEAQGKR